LNHKKTEILELPIAAVEQWVRQINLMESLTAQDKMNYKVIRAYLDSAIELMQANKENAAILNYAIKVLRGKTLTGNARDYYIKTVFHLAIIYPYLIPLLDENVFGPFELSADQIKKFAAIIYKENLATQNYEGVYYAIYFAIKYDFVIDELVATDVIKLTADDAIKANDCIVLVLTYCYFRKRGDDEAINSLKKHANEIKSDFDMYWLFLYEILPECELVDDWKAIKKRKVTFLAIPGDNGH
jgi:hypothetical protein